VLIGYRSITGFYRHNGLTWSASMAFWLTLSVPPLLIALSSIAQQVLGQEAAQKLIADQVAAQLPSQGGIISDIVSKEIPVFSVAGLGSLLFLLFSGSRIFSALIGAINAMWQHVEEVGIVRRQALRLVMVLLVGGMLLASVLLQLGILGASDQIGFWADILARYVVPLALVIGGLWLTYALLPRQSATWRTALVGAVVTAVVLRVAQFTFWYLLNNLIDFSTSYGPLAGVAILMTWAFVASAIVLVGAQFVAVLDRHRIEQLPLPSSVKGEPGEHND